MSWLRLGRSSLVAADFAAEHVTYKGVLSRTGSAARNEQAPPGFNRDTATITLGHGVDTFAAAQRAVDAWAMFALSWIDVAPPLPPLELGGVAVVTAGIAPGIAVVAASRITLVIDEQPAGSARYGFVYATMRTHPLVGEELFLVEHDAETDSVEYSLVAHSRPRHWLAWMGYPVVRLYQRRFRQATVRSMLAHVAG